ncbi:MAG TPA: alpha/beta fold hydrolase [Marmoricola sp.]
MPATAGYLGAAALAAEHLDLLVVGGVRDVHTSVAGRVHRVTDHVGGGVEHRIHDGIAGAVYGSIGWSLRNSAKAMRAVDRHRGVAGVEAGPRGRFVLSAVNGLIGEKVRAEVPDMSFEAGIRRGGRDVELTEDGVAAAFPAAGRRIVVFIHGLCETEAYWRRRSRPVREGEPSTLPYGTRLEYDHGWTPVYVRYNSGLPIAESGAAVSALIGRLTENWPTRVDEIALVGHSMGGLVLRAATTVSDQSGRASWTDRVTDVICLGTPHLGSYLERLAARGSRTFARLPETAPIARVLQQRSQGVLDLHDGLGAETANLPHARYHLVAASLSRSQRHPVALGIGDLLVQPRSAYGKPRRSEELFPGADTVHLPGANHFDLLNHDDVYAALEGWLA